MNSCQESGALIDAAPRAGKATETKMERLSGAMRAGAIAAVAVLLVDVSAGAETFVVDHWPSDVDNIPCSAWEKAGDGTWVLIGRIKIGSSEIANIGLKGDAAARAVEKKCGTK